MRLNPLRSLQGRFTLCLSFLIIVMMSVFSYWAVSKEKRLMTESIIREGRALVEALAISCTNTMVYEEIGLVEEGGLLDNYISDLMQRKDLQIVYAMVLGPTGEVISHNSVREVGNLYQDATTAEAIRSWSTLLQYPSPATLDISTPLAISTKRWGTLRVGISLERLNQEISGMVLRYALCIAGFILLAITIIAFLFGFITRPLKSLSQEMDAAPLRGSLPSVSVERRDEIGILQNSYYRMLRRIKEDDKERERTQKGLLLTEKMVAIGKLTAGMAHEINNPLGGILNCIYHFRKRSQPVEKQREYLDLMEDGIKRIQKTVTNLLEFARNPNLERTSTDFSLLLENTISLLDYQFRKNQIKIEMEIPRPLPSLNVDRNQIGQVLVNIFLNSLQAMQGGGVLKIEAAAQDGRFLVTVSDTGKGIPEEILPKVFDPFFTTKGEGTGTGLGLWISQGIIERHGGAIQIRSGEGKGTTVEIQLPVK
jgi:signal transduction histidine kinase